MGSPTAISSDGIDPRAWALTEQLARPLRTPTRVALRALAQRKWSTELNALLSREQVDELTSQERSGLRTLWDEAIRRGLRTNALPERKGTFEPCPPDIDAEAWSFAARVPRRGPTRRALRQLLALGLPTQLNAALTSEQVALLTKEHRLPLWELWIEARAEGIRTTAVPQDMVIIARPTEIDEPAWELSGALLGWRATDARDALRQIAARGQPTHLEVVVPMAVLLTLVPQYREGLQLLWSTARERGMRAAPVPDKNTEWRYRRDLDGVDEATIAFVHSRSESRLERFVMLWLRRLRAAGLPTDLDIDLELPDVRQLFDNMLDEAAKRTLAKTHDQLYDFRGAVRWLYTEAHAQAKRTRPVPREIACQFVYDKAARLGLTARLPQDDRQALATLKASLRELNRRQQAGRASPRKGGARTKKKTEAQSSSQMKLSALQSFLHHAQRWEAEELAAGAAASAWKIEQGLPTLLTPSNIARWAYKGHKPDGSPKAKTTCTTHHLQILRLLERAAEAGVAFVTPARLDEIKTELERVRDDEEWNVPNAMTEDADDYETGKWFPTLELLRLGIATLREDFQRAKLAHENGDTFQRWWRAARDYVMAYATLLCMWRVDTVATIDLSRVLRDPNTERVRWSDGSIRIRNGARAKQAHGHSYLVEMLIIPGEVVDLIEMLLQIEGRSLEKPLRPGEQAVLLQVGDRYGRDELLEASRTVVPLFRAEFDAPEALTVGSVIKRLQARLFAMAWDATNPHTFRAAGAIEWRFVRGRSYEAIMRLGLWTNEAVLKRCYARLNTADIDAEITDGAPSRELIAPMGSNALATALEEAHSKALALRIKPEAPSHELIATARVLRVAASRLEQQAGVSDGAVRPSPFRSDEHVVLVDQALRPLVKGGLNELLGYDVLQPTTAREKPARTERQMLRRLRAEARTAVTPRRSRRIA